MCVGGMVDRGLIDAPLCGELPQLSVVIWVSCVFARFGKLEWNCSLYLCLEIFLHFLHTNLSSENPSFPNSFESFSNRDDLWLLYLSMIFPFYRTCWRSQYFHLVRDTIVQLTRNLSFFHGLLKTDNLSSH